MRHSRTRASILLILGFVGGCASPDRSREDGQGLGSIDGAYYDSAAPGPYYDAYPYAYGGYGFGYGRGYYRPYPGRPGRDWGRGDARRGGDHSRGGDVHADQPAHPPAPAPAPAPSADPTPDGPSYNDIRAGKANTNAHQNVGGNRSSNSGGGGGKR